ncbi:MAG: retroviral-like aspartic protease family protein [Synechococcales cyanobacterium C42_A2020_086]|nr:retroviral-like aspartic protease family protein [Synechococcales cyanobacterium C42_A2020_086]
MPKPIFPMLMLTCTLASIVSACTSSVSDVTDRLDNASPPSIETPPVPASVPASVPHSPAAANPYEMAIERASSAYRFSQSAQSRDDWRLVASRWQQAMDLLQTVPPTHPQYRQSQQKLGEYRRNLTFAQQQANRQTAPANSNGVIVLPPVSRPATPVTPITPVTTASPTPVAAPVASPLPATPSPNTPRVFYAPIIRREGNTPVISVLFNDNQRFDMIVDTGASGTLITRQMAAALGVVPVAQTSVDTASERGVSFPLGYVRQMEVGGAVATNVLVAVAGPELDIGLLGHDFFGHYDVTIRAAEVEFRERSKAE